MNTLHRHAIKKILDDLWLLDNAAVFCEGLYPRLRDITDNQHKTVERIRHIIMTASVSDVAVEPVSGGAEPCD